jgi:hypothetical protein
MRWLARRRNKRGQSLVEFAITLPILMFLVLGMVEMGWAINHNTTIVTATRQGARVGAELVNGSNSCSNNTNAATVDPQIIGAVQGVLASSGSPINVSQITEIDIFEVDMSTTSPTVTGHQQVWVQASPPSVPLPGSSPTQYLLFKPSGAGTWNANTRCGNSPADGLGVRITYTYNFITPLGGLVTAFSSGKITMSDSTVMALEPPTQ